MLQLHSIQFLRGIAAILVVYLHMNAYTVGQEIRLGLRTDDILSNNWFYFGRFGVDIFFVISGFIMFYVTQNAFAKKNASWVFIKKRIIRIVPIFWFFSVVAIAQTLAFIFLKNNYPQFFSAAFDVPTLDWLAAFKSFLFIPTFNTEGKIYLPLQSGWTLLFEMFFYAVFALLLIFKKGAALKVLFTLFFMLTAIGLSFDLKSNPFFFIYTNPLILEFLLGIVIALIYTKKIKASPFISCLSIIMGVIGIILFYTSVNIQTETPDYINTRILFYGIPCALIVFGFLNLEVNKLFKNIKPFSLLGDWSYSLYLCHKPVGIAAGKILSIMGFFDIFPPFMMTMLLISICVFAAYISYRFIEVPLTEFLKEKFLKQKALT